MRPRLSVSRLCWHCQDRHAGLDARFRLGHFRTSRLAVIHYWGVGRCWAVVLQSHYQTCRVHWLSVERRWLYLYYYYSRAEDTRTLDESRLRLWEHARSFGVVVRSRCVLYADQMGAARPRLWAWKNQTGAARLRFWVDRYVDAVRHHLAARAFSGVAHFR